MDMGILGFEEALQYLLGEGKKVVVWTGQPSWEVPQLRKQHRVRTLYKPVVYEKVLRELQNS